MSKNKRFINTAATYFAGNILSKLVTFFLIPLYTNKLAPEEYGNYDVGITLVTLFVSVAFFQIWDGMFRFAFDRDDEKSKYDLIGNAMAVYGLGLVLFIICLCVAGIFLDIMFLPLAIVYGVFFALQYMYSFMARVFLKNKLFVFSGTLNTLTAALCNIFCILALNMGIESLYLAQILGCLVQISVIEFNLKIIPSLRTCKLDTSCIKEMLKFSIPLCIATISYWLLNGYTKLVINQTLGAYENGIYAIASSLANTAVIAVNVFQFAWNEMAYMSSKEENRKKFYSDCISLLFSTITFGCAIVCMGIKLLFPILVGEEYRSSIGVIPILMIGVSANAIAGFLGTLFMTEKKTTYILLSTLVSAAINICFSGFAAKQYGLEGTVWVLTVSFLALLIIRIIQLIKKFQVSVSVKSLISCVSLILGLIIYEYVNNTLLLVLGIAVFAVLYVLFVIWSMKLDLKKLLARRK